MRYWPLSVIALSPLLPPVYVPELFRAYQDPRLSQEAVIACNQVMELTPHVETPLVIVHSVKSPSRRVYLEYPQFEDWMRLERGGFVDTPGDGTYFIIDALH